MQMVGQQNNTKPQVVVGRKDRTMNEARGTCWVGYKQVGMKDKGGRKDTNTTKELTPKEKREASALKVDNENCNISMKWNDCFS